MHITPELEAEAANPAAASAAKTDLEKGPENRPSGEPVVVGRREHFIPLRKSHLLKLLVGEPNLSPQQQDQLERLSRLLEATFHFEYHQRLEELKDLYAPFDPDADTERWGNRTPEQQAALCGFLFERFRSLLERGNFLRLSREEIERTASTARQFGVNVEVDLEQFEQLEVYVRGDRTTRARKRSWRSAYRLREVEIPEYQRLVVIFRLHPERRRDKTIDSECVYLKIFKNVPKKQLDMLLPGSRMRISRLDQSRIWIPMISGLGMTSFKLVTGASLLLSNPLALLGLIAGAVGYGVKSFFGYLRTKDKYQHTVTRSLYYQNLDNNAGVLFRLLDEAEEQECREALLAYFYLWRHAGPAGWTEPYLDEQVEGWLRRRCGLDVDFEVDDALAKLARLKLAEQNGDRWTVCEIETALERLDYAWDNFFTYNKG